MATEFSKQLGHRIRYFRKISGLTQEQLSEKIGLFDNFIGMIERAERNTTVQNAFKIAKALGMKLLNCSNYSYS